ncbi:MAG: DM13 domain-containing protein [Acidimicrobiales bacterium]
MQPQTPPPTPGFIRRNLLAVLGAGTLALAGLAWLAFGYFGIHTAFIDDEVSEAGPVFASGAAADEPAAADGDAAPTTDADDEAEATDGEADAAAADGGTAPEPADDAEADAPAEIVTLVSGSFTGLGSYSGGGDAVVLNDGTEQRFLRFEENFETSNGPDLNVYLTVGGDVDAGYVDLGDLRGNIGSQNYEIPVEVDLAQFDTVVIWCVRFGVGFAEAPLA